MLFRRLRIHQILGAGTDVGKTIFSTALCRAAVASGNITHYVKPIGTGGGTSGDEGHIQKYAGKCVKSTCLYSFHEPVSPHLAVKLNPSASQPGGVPSDEEFVQSIATTIRGAAGSLSSNSVMYIEGAGGVHSPSLSGTSQLVSLRPLRLPTILVASPALGGISSTISAYESLMLHGYDLDAILIIREDYYRNWEYISKWGLERNIKVVVCKPPPQSQSSSDAELTSMSKYYDELGNTACEEDEHLNGIKELHDHLQYRHEQRIHELATLPRRTLDQVWWPFVQHGTAECEEDVSVFDSAWGDYMYTHRKVEHESSNFSPVKSPKVSGSTSLINPLFDGSASWWTQTLGHSSPDLAFAAAAAAGRYGHVILPHSTHAPAVELTERLLQSVGKGWASRVFFSDDGSTAAEVALKMGLASYSRRHGLDGTSGKELGVFGLRGSYHGDTIGAMDASEHSTYNAQVDWYKGKGYWLEPPIVQIKQGGSVVVQGEGVQWATSSQLSSTKLGAWWQRSIPGGLAGLYDVEDRLHNDSLTDSYRTHIKITLEEAVTISPYTLATLIMEPVVMGAGGMLFVDPLFQRILVDFIRDNDQLFHPHASPEIKKIELTAVDGWSGLPIIFDEVFTGLRRLGRISGGSFLGDSVKPDIAVYAKILTAGMVPMGVTLSNQSIFNTFKGQTKLEALLHGHSYTAHPIGCSIANKGFEILDKMEKSNHWANLKDEWVPERESNQAENFPWSFWSPDFLESVMKLEGVDGAMALGCVLSIYLRDSSGSGYTSSAASRLINNMSKSPLRIPELLGASPAGMPFGIHARPLGNVAYFMTSLSTPVNVVRSIEAAVLHALQKS